MKFRANKFLLGIFSSFSLKNPANMIKYIQLINIETKEGVKLQTYICKHCDDLICETSICPVCGQRTELLKTEIFYCEHCNSPVYSDTCPECGSKCNKIGSDIRPVFAEERLLIEILLNKPFAFAGKAVWNTGANNYVVDGKRIRVSFSELRKQDPLEVIKKIQLNFIKNEQYIASDLTNEHITRFIKINHCRLNVISDEAISYIRKMAEKFDLSSIFVSFSGGKDSTVTSHLVMRALGTESVIHIYGDTTLEYPESAKYIFEFKKHFKKTPVLIAKNNDQDFGNLCEVVGPPSRVMRWCCTIFKTGAITRKIEQTFRGKTRLLSFQGIRRAESLSRSKYERDSDSPKIAKQIVSAPIIDWTDFDVWLYILSNDIPFNGAYKQGFSRVGCWCCPNNSGWSEFLSSIYMNDEFNKFRNILYEFAKKIGKSDWKQYIDEGSWKARQGGNGLEHSKNAVVDFKPCVMEENTTNFSLTKPISDQLYVLFIPFGKVNFSIGNKRLNEVFVISKRTDQPFIKLSGRQGSTVLKVTILNVPAPFKNSKEIVDLIRNQLVKYQTCIGCTYCQAVCKFNALKVNNTEKGSVSNQSIQYFIDSSKCVGCLECVKHFDGGCYMKKVLRTKKGE